MATRQDIETHYDGHDDIFLKVLDPKYLAYSTGHWEAAVEIDAAQTAKFAYIAAQVALSDCRNVLEIGSGWGSFARYCHDHHPDLQVVGLTLSSTQKEYVDAQDWPNFTCILADWRDFVASEPFDAVVADHESNELRWVAVDEVQSLPLHPGFASAWPELRTWLR